jgi:tyrosine-protein kinase Etk/Wzc
MEDLFQDNINYKKIVHRLLSHKKLYYIAIIVLLIAAFLVNKFSEPKYANSTIISVNNNNNKQNALLSSQNDLMQGIGLFNGTENIENELEKIKSFTVINEVVKNLDLKVTYNSFKNSNLSNMLYNTPLVKKHELYDDSPIKVIVDASQAQAIDMKFRIVFINDDEFLLETSGDNVPLYNYIDDQVVSVVNSIYFKKRFHFGDEIKTRYFNFRIIKTDRFDKEYTQSNNLFFVLENTNTLTLNYIASTSVENTSKLSTLIKVSVVGHNRRKITDFLNTLISVYFEQNMEKKNSAALSTVSFIDSQISEIADSLGRAETKLKNFRTTNQVMDLSFQGQQVFTQMNKLEDEKATIETQKRYYS